MFVKIINQRVNMEIFIVVIYGVLVGFVASKMFGSGFGIWWDIYLGALGSILANCLVIWSYFMGVLPVMNVVGLNVISVSEDIIGAVALIYTEQGYNKINFVIKERYRNRYRYIKV